MMFCLHWYQLWAFFPVCAPQPWDVRSAREFEQQHVHLPVQRQREGGAADSPFLHLLRAHLLRDRGPLFVHLPAWGRGQRWRNIPEPEKKTPHLQQAHRRPRSVHWDELWRAKTGRPLWRLTCQKKYKRVLNKSDVLATDNGDVWSCHLSCFFSPSRYMWSPSNTNTWCCVRLPCVLQDI